VVQVTSLFPSVRELGLLLFDGGLGTFLWSQWGALGLCALWEAGLLPPAVYGLAIQWRSWDFRSQTRETELSCRHAQWEMLGL
jgi:hypothetical protein